MYTEIFFLGLLLLFLGFILIIIGMLISSGGKETRIEGGGVVLIGPIPIVFASNYKIAIVLLVLTILLMILVYLLFYTTPLPSR